MSGPHSKGEELDSIFWWDEYQRIYGHILKPSHHIEVKCTFRKRIRSWTLQNFFLYPVVGQEVVAKISCRDDRKLEIIKPVVFKPNFIIFCLYSKTLFEKQNFS